MADFIAEVEDIVTVPADQHWMYKQEGTAWKLDSESPSVKWAVSNVSGLTNAIKKVRDELKTAKGQSIDLTPLSTYGKNPEEIAEAIKAQKEQLEQQIKGVNVDKIREGITKEYEPQLTKEKNRSTALASQLNRVLVTGEAANALAAAQGNANLLMPVIQNKVKVVEANGEYTVHVVDEAGETRYEGARPMTISDLVKELKATEEYGICFKSEAAAGTGTKPGTTYRPAPAKTTDKATMSSTDKIAAGIRKGQATMR